MSDEAGAAPAAAEPIAAPVDEQIVDVPNPVETVDQPVKAEPKGPPTIKEALDKAEKTVQAKQAAEKIDPKAEVKAKPEAKEPADNRDTTTGQFKPKADSEKPAEAVKPVDAAKPSHTAEDAPTRFTETAKAKWAAADPEIRGETLRMQRELTQGYEKHKDSAAKWDGLKEFDDIATKSGTTVKDALSRYVGMEQKLRGDLIGGLDEIVANATGGKSSLRDVAAHIMGQTPEQAQSQSDATIRELKQTVQRLEQQVGGVTQTITQQREQSTLQEVTKFADANPRFEELADDIGFFMKSGRAKDLSEAYQLAERLNPAPAKATTDEPKAADASAKIPDLAEQIRKGQKSPTGAPSAGSDPAAKRSPSKTIRGSLDRAFEQASIR